MIYAVLKEPDEIEPGLYCFDTWDQFHAATFSPELDITAVWNDKPLTRNKEKARDELHQISDALYRGYAWSYGELATIYQSAERIARRAGLIREARENGII